ncbi:RNA 2',3'-cyclic phosphodiesterase [Candidatus Microgenomates bacterium]|nr:RNA 2',3'-cyclic phosphodiesterase [Candidatus Microgenomates bacterium]
MKTRLFIAIDFPKKTKKEIANLVDKLKSQYPQIRWEKRENIHLTLKFLNWAEERKVKKILEGIKRGAGGIKPFGFKLEKLGYFLSQSLIVWLGVEAQSELFQIVKNLEKEMKKLAFPKEKRVFSPHITIGWARRVSPRRKWLKIAEEIKNFPTPSFSKFQVKEIILMKSQLTQKGSIYSIVNRVFLK